MAIAGWEGGTSRKRGVEEAIDEWDLSASEAARQTREHEIRGSASLVAVSACPHSCGRDVLKGGPKT